MKYMMYIHMHMVYDILQFQYKENTIRNELWNP